MAQDFPSAAHLTPLNPLAMPMEPRRRPLAVLQKVGDKEDEHDAPA